MLTTDDSSSFRRGTVVGRTEGAVPEILLISLTVDIIHDEVGAISPEIGILCCCCSICSKAKHPTNHPSILVIPLVIATQK